MGIFKIFFKNKVKTYKVEVTCNYCLVSGNVYNSDMVAKCQVGTKIEGQIVKCKCCGNEDKVRIGINGIGVPKFYIN